MDDRHGQAVEQPCSRRYQGCMWHVGVDNVDAFVAKYTENGELNKLYQKWLQTDLPQLPTEPLPAYAGAGRATSSVTPQGAISPGGYQIVMLEKVEPPEAGDCEQHTDPW